MIANPPLSEGNATSTASGPYLLNVQRMGFAIKAPTNVLAGSKKAQNVQTTISVSRIGAIPHRVPVLNASAKRMKIVRRTVLAKATFSAARIPKNVLTTVGSGNNVLEIKNATPRAVWEEDALLPLVAHPIHALTMRLVRRIAPISFAQPLYTVATRKSVRWFPRASMGRGARMTTDANQQAAITSVTMEAARRPLRQEDANRMGAFA